jgi:hypothetical protein
MGLIEPQAQVHYISRSCTGTFGTVGITFPLKTSDFTNHPSFLPSFLGTLKTIFYKY